MKFFDEKKIEFIQKWNSSKIQNLNFSRQNSEIFSKLKIGPKTGIYFLKKSYIESDFWPNVYQKLSFKKPPKNRISNFCFFLFFRWSRRIKLKIWLYLQHRKSHSIKKNISPPLFKNCNFCFSFFLPSNQKFRRFFENVWQNIWRTTDNGR